MSHDEILDVLVAALKKANTSTGPNDFRPLIIATEAVCHELDRVVTALESIADRVERNTP